MNLQSIIKNLPKDKTTIKFKFRTHIKLLIIKDKKYQFRYSFGNSGGNKYGSRRTILGYFWNYYESEYSYS